MDAFPSRRMPRRSLRHLTRPSGWTGLRQLVCGPHRGDELLPEPVLASTYGVTIAASAGTVWSWLVQIGQNRGGRYSYAWLENLFGLDIHNADAVRPPWQRLDVRDRVWLVPAGRMGLADGYAFRVAVVDPPRALVLRQQPSEHPWDGTWAFVIIPHRPGRSVLLARSRTVQPAGLAGIGSRVGTELTNPVMLLMTRKMLLGIKERAERSLPGAADNDDAGRRRQGCLAGCGTQHIGGPATSAAGDGRCILWVNTGRCLWVAPAGLSKTRAPTASRVSRREP